MSSVLRKFKQGILQGRALYSSRGSLIFTGARNILDRVHSIDQWARSMAPENQAIQQIVQNPIYNEILGGVGFLQAKLPDVEKGVKELDRLAGEASKIIDQVQPIVQMGEKVAQSAKQSASTPSPSVPSVPTQSVPTPSPSVPSPIPSSIISLPRPIKRGFAPKLPVVKERVRVAPPTPVSQPSHPQQSAGIVPSLVGLIHAKDNFTNDIFQRLVPSSIPIFQSISTFGKALGFS